MKKPILSAAVLAIGLVAAAATFGFYYKEARVVVTSQTQSISVKGYAEKNISSDKATWTGRRHTGSWSSNASNCKTFVREKTSRRARYSSLLCLPKRSMSSAQAAIRQIV